MVKTFQGTQERVPNNLSNSSHRSFRIFQKLLFRYCRPWYVGNSFQILTQKIDVE